MSQGLLTSTIEPYSDRVTTAINTMNYTLFRNKVILVLLMVGNIFSGTVFMANNNESLSDEPDHEPLNKLVEDTSNTEYYNTFSINDEFLPPTLQSFPHDMFPYQETSDTNNETSELGLLEIRHSPSLKDYQSRYGDVTPESNVLLALEVQERNQNATNHENKNIMPPSSNKHFQKVYLNQMPFANTADSQIKVTSEKQPFQNILFSNNVANKNASVSNIGHQNVQSTNVSPIFNHSNCTNCIFRQNNSESDVPNQRQQVLSQVKHPYPFSLHQKIPVPVNLHSTYQNYNSHQEVPQLFHSQKNSLFSFPYQESYQEVPTRGGISPQFPTEETPQYILSQEEESLFSASKFRPSNYGIQNTDSYHATTGSMPSIIQFSKERIHEHGSKPEDQHSFKYNPSENANHHDSLLINKIHNQPQEAAVISSYNDLRPKVSEHNSFDKSSTQDSNHSPKTFCEDCKLKCLNNLSKCVQAAKNIGESIVMKADCALKKLNSLKGEHEKSV